MRIILYKIISHFQWLCMILSFIFSILFMKNFKDHLYMNRMLLYSTVGALLAIMIIFNRYFPLYGRVTVGYIESVLLIFHFVFLSLFINNVIGTKKRSRIIVVLFIVFFISILFCILTSNIAKPQSNAFAFSNLGLVIFCLLYYLQLFDSVPTVNLIKEPSFWIITGVFFCMCATIPVLAIRHYMLEKISASLYKSIEIVIPFSYGVMHLFFIKAYLCTAKLSKV